jgi:hypothetical protein
MVGLAGTSGHNKNSSGGLARRHLAPPDLFEMGWQKANRIALAVLPPAHKQPDSWLVAKRDREPAVFHILFRQIAIKDVIDDICILILDLSLCHCLSMPPFTLQRHFNSLLTIFPTWGFKGVCAA